MICFGRPSTEQIRRFLDDQSKTSLTYAPVGATASTPPSNYVVDHTRHQLGHGALAFQAARSALLNWEQFQLGWLEAIPYSLEPFRSGDVVGVNACFAGICWLNACRIIYVVDESEPVRRFGFAYGTLPSHIGSGEERFLVEWDPGDDAVNYDILAFSRPRTWIARIGYPLFRRVQRRFGRESAAAMSRFVARELAK